LAALELVKSDAAVHALAVLLAEALEGSRGFAMDAGDWQDHAAFIRALDPPRRAVLMRAWYTLDELRSFDWRKPVQDLADMRGLDRAQVMAPLVHMAKAMPEHEIKSVALADYCSRADEHEAALRAVLAEPECRFPNNERWFPAEVVELTAHVPSDPGAIACTALCILDDIHNNGDYDQMSFRWGQHSETYLTWHECRRLPILRGIRYLYERDPHGSWGFQYPKAAQPIPWFET
ncbi:MAG: hypothetical protein OXD48_04990, partial [Litoreibacter sp.]|nr:hypothetical protein [Litoreibacter sp.]